MERYLSPRGCFLTWKEGSFRETDEEASSTETSTVGHGWHADCAGAPAEHDSRKKVLRVGLGQEKIARQLADEVADIEDRNTGVPDLWNC
jgi:hypothetical protein